MWLQARTSNRQAPSEKACAFAFVGGGERVCEEKRTRSHAEANAFTLGGERVRTRRQTRLHANANARSLYLASERYCIYTCTCMTELNQKLDCAADHEQGVASYPGPSQKKGEGLVYTVCACAKCFRTPP